MHRLPISVRFFEASPLPPGTHHYRFLVDGEWRDDPECKMQVPNAFGTRNSVRQVH